MNVRLEKPLKLVGILALVCIIIASCAEDDLNSIDAGFIDNISFTTEEKVYDITFNNENIQRIPTKSDGQFLMGVYEEKKINTVRGSFVSHLALPSDVFYHSDTVNEIFTVTPRIDDVVLYLPYHATFVKNFVNEQGVEQPIHKIDSIFGIQQTVDDAQTSAPFDVNVHELATFLNPLDPSDPSTGNVLYSDAEYDSENVLATVADFVIQNKDTVTDIYRGDDENNEPIIEKIRLSSKKPRVAIHLNKTVFFDKILSKLPKPGEEIPNEFKSQDHFIRYFKGLFVEVTSSDPAAVATLPLTDAFVEMYYTNVKTATVDGMPKEYTIARTMRFNLGGVKGAKFENLGNPTIDPQKLYVQGTAGVNANIQLLGLDKDNPKDIPSALMDLREQSNLNGKPIWLVNEASLQLYIDSEYESTNTPNRLYLYKNVPDAAVAIGVGYRSQLLDYITASNISTFDGILTTETVDGETRKFYKFRLTDYITELIKSDNTKNVDNLALKLYTVGDFPTTSSDTLVNRISWDPRGVVLHAGTSGDEADAKRAVLKINYSYQNRTQNDQQ